MSQTNGTPTWPLFACVALVLHGLVGCATSSVDVHELQRRAEAGDSEAQFQMGNAYDFGQGVAVNRVEAGKWYRLAAENGHAAAQNNLGSLYQNGAGVAQDYKVARAWYEKSAAQSYPMAWNSLGYMYDFGLGVETNAQRAVEYYGKAAEKGDAYGMLNLGVSYSLGSGVSQNLVEAYKWLDLARFYTQFSPDTKLKWRARGMLDQVAKKMSREQIAEAARLSQAWDREHRAK